MGKIIVDVLSARNLKHEDGLLGKIDPYLELKIGHLLSAQKHKTKTHKDAGSSVDFNETFEFTAEPHDDLKVRLYDDDLVNDDEAGQAKIPLQGVFETGQLESWFPLGKKSHGEVLLRLRAA
ncbi:Extended synaptotagmin-3 [Mortierella alpina]|nr:Extended synaptotagmin-3 [Mortierella alpina]